MGDKTGIEWTDATWNPIRGCSRVSEGCKNCYAETQAWRFRAEGQPYEGLLAKGGQWNGNIKLVEHLLEQPLKWKKPRRIFVNSMSDLFHENVPFDFIDKVFAVMAMAPQHTFQVLTKRPERMLEYRKSTSLIPWKGAVIGPRNSVHLWPHVWLGVSVEDQKTADERIPLLLQTPAAVRWISAEPLLGEIDLMEINGSLLTCKESLGSDAVEDGGIDWVVVGGESGKDARPMHSDWVRSLRDQCVDAGVPFLFKQWGEWADSTESPKLRATNNVIFKSDGEVLGAGCNWGGMVEPDLKKQGGKWMSKVGKKKAGRNLDGRTWDEYPA